MIDRRESDEILGKYEGDCPCHNLVADVDDDWGLPEQDKSLKVGENRVPCLGDAASVVAPDAFSGYRTRIDMHPPHADPHMRDKCVL